MLIEIRSTKPSGSSVVIRVVWGASPDWRDHRRIPIPRCCMAALTRRQGSMIVMMMMITAIPMHERTIIVRALASLSAQRRTSSRQMRRTSSRQMRQPPVCRTGGKPRAAMKPGRSLNHICNRSGGKPRAAIEHDDDMYERCAAKAAGHTKEVTTVM